MIRDVYPRLEKMANERSDGRIYVTEGVRDYIQEKYDVDASKDMVFYSYVSKSMVPSQLRRRISEKDGETHIVYIGTVTSIIKDSHYDLREIFREIADHGIHVHVYVSIWGAKDKAYQHLAEENDLIHYHGHLDQKSLLQEIPQYDFGWAGFNVNRKNREHLDVALPNKVFEYVGCGLPVLAFPHKDIRNFLNRYNLGLVFNDVGELVKQLKSDEVSKIRKHVLSSRHQFSIENKIPRVIDFYEKIIGGDQLASL